MAIGCQGRFLGLGLVGSRIRDGVARGQGLGLGLDDLRRARRAVREHDRQDDYRDDEDHDRGERGDLALRQRRLFSGTGRQLDFGGLHFRHGSATRQGLEGDFHHPPEARLPLFRRRRRALGDMVGDREDRERLALELGGEGIELRGLHLDGEDAVFSPELPGLLVVVEHVRRGYRADERGDPFRERRVVRALDEVKARGRGEVAPAETVRV